MHAAAKVEEEERHGRQPGPATYAGAHVQALSSHPKAPVASFGSQQRLCSTADVPEYDSPACHIMSAQIIHAVLAVSSGLCSTTDVPDSGRSASHSMPHEGVKAVLAQPQCSTLVDLSKPTNRATYQ